MPPQYKDLFVITDVHLIIKYIRALLHCLKLYGLKFTFL